MKLLTDLLTALLDGQRSRRQRVLLAVVTLAFAVGGAMSWISFFEWGHFSFAKYDWPKERDAFAVFAQAIQQGIAPLYSTVSHQGTTRFLANPEIPWTPDLLLLRWLDLNSFVVVHVLLFFLVGLAGCLRAAVRLGFSPVSLAALFLLTCFNGHVVSHLAVGHSMWVGAFLLPWLVLAIRELAQDRPPRGASISVVVILMLLLLAGSFHLTAISVIYLCLFALLNRGHARDVLRILVAAALLGAVRIVPALGTMGIGPRSIGFGYPDLWTLVEALVMSKSLDAPTFDYTGAGWWEFDAYIGLEGLAILVVLGLVVGRTEADNRFRRIMLPAAVLAILSLGNFYFLIHTLHIPVFGAERVVSRFILLPLLLLSMESCLHFQRLVARRGAVGVGTALLAVAGVWQLTSALTDHMAAISMGATGQVPALAPLHQAPAAIDVSHALEPGYLGALAVGAVISLIGCGVMLVWWRRGEVSRPVTLEYGTAK